ncbi:MAG: hypothetical protein V3U18_09035, partial [Alphaproteobacteria bacterium]
KSQAFYEFNMARIDQFAEASTGRPADGLSVVMLGNSRLKYATLSEAEMVALAESRGLGEMRFLEFVNNWAIFEDFEGLAAPLLEAEPDLIVFQLELLVKERADFSRLLLLREYVLWQLLGIGPWNPGNIDQRALQFDRPCANDHSQDAIATRLERTERWLSYDALGRSARLARDFIATATVRGIPVVLLSIPKTQKAEEFPILATSTLWRMLDHEVERLESNDKVSHWRYTAAIPDGEFCDVVHMNESARRNFSAWLVSRLTDMRHMAIDSRRAEGSPGS